MPGNDPVAEYLQHEFRPFGSDFLCESQPPERLREFDINQGRRMPFLREYLIGRTFAPRCFEEELQRNGCIDDDHSYR